MTSNSGNHLEKLFYEWKEKFFLNETFYKDGIINEALYKANPKGKKLLFIAKEPNATNHEPKGYSSFCDEWNTSTPDYGFAFRVAEWAHGILEDFPLFDLVVKDRLAYLKKIAFMNIKKSGGGGLVKDSNAIYNVAKEQLEYIRKELSIIEPDIIVLSLSQDKRLRTLLFPQAKEWRSSGYGIEIARSNGQRIIDFYHPSSRNVPAESYCLLKSVIQGEAFQKL